MNFSRAIYCLILNILICITSVAQAQNTKNCIDKSDLKSGIYFTRSDAAVLRFSELENGSVARDIIQPLASGARDIEIYQNGIYTDKILIIDKNEKIDRKQSETFKYLETTPHPTKLTKNVSKLIAIKNIYNGNTINGSIEYNRLEDENIKIKNCSYDVTYISQSFNTGGYYKVIGVIARFVR